MSDEKKYELPGFKVRENAFGFTAISMHYRCDPEKDPLNPDPVKAEKAQKWLDLQKQSWPDPNDFQREFELSFFIGKGQRVFPQFSQQFHVRPIALNPRKAVYRAWDFGWHAPVCLFAQIDNKERLCIVRELVGFKQTTHEFAGSVLKQTALWFPNHAPGFDDYCDPAGQQVKSVENEKNERRDVEILNGLGIYPKFEYGWSRKDGRSLVHRLLTLRSDSTPSLWVDESHCPLLAQAFLGRYVYPETKDGKIKEDPDDDTHPWADLMAALRYLVIGLHKKLSLMKYAVGQQAAAPPAAASYHGYGTPHRT